MGELNIALIFCCKNDDNLASIETTAIHPSRLHVCLEIRKDNPGTSTFCNHSHKNSSRIWMWIKRNRKLTPLMFLPFQQNIVRNSKHAAELNSVQHKKNRLPSLEKYANPFSGHWNSRLSQRKPPVRGERIKRISANFILPHCGGLHWARRK